MSTNSIQHFQFFLMYDYSPIDFQKKNINVVSENKLYVQFFKKKKKTTTKNQKNTFSWSEKIDFFCHKIL